MLKPALVAPSTTIDVRFLQPQTIMADGLMHTTDYQIEYQSADAPALARGNSITIDGVTYKVKNPPRKQGDGFFTYADLEKT